MLGSWYVPHPAITLNTTNIFSQFMNNNPILNRAYDCGGIFNLVGGIPTPLKNMSSSVGMMTFPIYEKSYRPWPCSTMESHKSHVPNHQPEVIVDKLVSPEKEHLLAIGETQSHILGYLTYYSTPLENNHPPQ